MEKSRMGRNTLYKKLNGFQKAPRNRFKFLLEKILSHEELLLYELGIAITDWDINHKDTYGSFQASNQELAEILGWRSDTTAGRHKNSLIEKKFFKIRDDKRIAPWKFEDWQIRKLDAKTQVKDANNEFYPANMQNKTAKIEDSYSQTSDYSLVSSKGNIGSFDEVEVVTEEEMDALDF